MAITLDFKQNSSSPSAVQQPSVPAERPRRRDPIATRKAILDAAQALFASYGPVASSLTRVAKKAGVTKSLIHHHFGTKEELWEEVQSRYFQEYFEMQKTMLENSKSTADLVRDSMVSYFKFLRKNPQSVRFLTWSFASHDGDHNPTSEEEQLYELGIEKIKDSQRRGEIRSDLEPFFIIKTMLALPFQWFLTRENTLSLLDQNMDGNQLDELYLRETIEVFLCGIRPQNTSEE